MIATVWAVAVEHVVSFGLGVFVGFVLADRYRLIRRGGDNDG